MTFKQILPFFEGGHSGPLVKCPPPLFLVCKCIRAPFFKKPDLDSDTSVRARLDHCRGSDVLLGPAWPSFPTGASFPIMRNQNYIPATLVLSSWCLQYKVCIKSASITTDQPEPWDLLAETFLWELALVEGSGRGLWGCSPPRCQISLGTESSWFPETFWMCLKSCLSWRALELP